jgi:hypothetical protein
MTAGLAVFREIALPRRNVCKGSMPLIESAIRGVMPRLEPFDGPYRLASSPRPRRVCGFGADDEGAGNPHAMQAAGGVWRRAPKVVRQRFEVLHDGRQMELVARAGEAS